LWVVCAAIVVALAGVRAWVDEDVFITFRTIDNFVNGYGLRWNVDERVQTFTHPLWMMLCTPLYYVTREVSTTVTVLCLACTAGVVLVAGSRYRARPLVLCLGLGLPLALSSSFLEYSTSGFENPLVHLCLAWFAIEYLRHDAGATPWGTLALAGGLSSLTRLDTTLFFVPPLALLLLLRWRSVRWWRFLAGLSPIFAWLLFSLFYYGFAFPNTKLAKINEEIPLADYMVQGSFYALDLLRRDPVGFTVLCVGIASTVVRGWLAVRRRDPACLRMAVLGAGMMLYCLYVIGIGGCYLSGRFWTAPIVIATILWSEELSRLMPRLASARVAAVAAAVIAAVVVGIVVCRPVLERMEYPGHILPEARAKVFLDDGWTWQLTDSAQKYREVGIRKHALAEASGKAVYLARAIGLAGLAGGPKVTIIDRNALADPLLARLPCNLRHIRMIGHFPRPVPEGYKRARTTGSLDAMQPALQEYYRALRTVVSGPLFSWERLRTLVAFNLGAYDHFLAEYITTVQRSK